MPSSIMHPSALSERSTKPYSKHVNPQWVKLLDLLQMNENYVRCEGAELFTSSGRTILDFLSGYCVHNTGHNHPHVISALQDELQRRGPAMLQSHVPQLAGELGEKLCALSGGQLKKAFFCSSGSEGVETAIKFARAKTRRDGLLYCRGAFHGLTCGALSLMGDGFWRNGFGPLLPSCYEIPFDDLAELERALASKPIAAFFVEPVQGEAGINVPSPDYLSKAGALCRKYGTLLVLDEVQTGLGRTGRFLAGHHFSVGADMVILAKALSGGLVPSGAVLMSEEIYDSVYDSLKHAIVHTSTYSENALAMRAGLATLEVLENERLPERAERLGRELQQRLRESLSAYEMVKRVRGLGLMCGVEFTAPRSVRLRIPFETFRSIHAGMFGQMIVMRLFREHDILSQICGNNFMVLKVAPPLIITETQLDKYVGAITEVVEAIHATTAFWKDALALAKRAVNI